MTSTRFEIEGLLLLEPDVFQDERGYFFESFNQNKFEVALGFKPEFVQDNESMSSKHVLRGLHFQEPPFEQAKLVRVIRGAVTDVCVDIRKNSTTFGQHIAVDLSAENKHMLYIPAGFAHGFVTRENNTIFSYKCTGPYNKASENAIHWEDPQLCIDWHVKDPIISTKDKEAGSFAKFKSKF